MKKGEITRRGFILGSLATSAGAVLPGCTNDDDKPATKSKESDSADFEIETIKNRLWEEAGNVFKHNRLYSSIGLFHLPSAQTYRSFFAWDSGWNVIALSLIDPEFAFEELTTIFSVQCEDGHIPHEVRIPGLEETDPLRILTQFFVRRQFDEQGRSRFIDPPSYLIAAEILFQRTGDERIFEFLPAMERCVDYLLGPRDLFGDGLVSIIHPWESGTDSAPIFDDAIGIDVSNPLVLLQYLTKYPRLLNYCADLNWDLAAIANGNRFVFEEVGFNAITAAGLVSMATLYEEAGQPNDANRCYQLASNIVKKMEATFWDEQEGFFFPRYDLQEPSFPLRRCITGLAPLITGLVDAEKAERIIEDALVNENHFYGPHLVPFSSISETEEHIPAEGTLLWRGHCIWANMNWIAARAAAMYGHDNLAKKITRATAVMVDQEGFREFYDSRTGAGDGAMGFTWPALVLDMIDRYGM